ncbi:MAG TPA: phage major capsid protein [Rhizomicrobium sp.]|jgi:HK97 family phage major capsid protein|nr:phage major capsid protein [Rhizomicrobium sp.]
MRKFSMSALLAAATLFPRRAAAQPTLSLAAPSLIAPTPRALIGTVRADVSDPKVLIGQIQTAFEEFKKTNDAAVGAKADDAVVTAKLAAIEGTITDLSAALDEHAKAAAALKLNGGGGNGREVPDAEYSKLFGSFVRDGQREHEEKLKSEQRVGVRAAMSEGSSADGGYTTPVEWDRTLTGRLKLISPIRQEATVQSISKAGFTKLFTDRAVGSGWVGETASRPATSTPQMTSLGFAPGEIYANAAASQDLLDDSEVDIEAWLTGEISTEFARQEGIAFVSGDGSNKPFGILGYLTGGAAAARHPWGDIKLVKSGATAAFTADGIISTVYALPSTYTPNAKWFMNRNSLGSVRKLKDGQGNYIWQPTFVAGQPSTLAGYPLIDVPDMPDLAAGATPALFGDMRETYLVIDRVGFRVLRDPYTNKPFIAFYCTKRVGGGVKNPDSMKAVTISA